MKVFLIGGTGLVGSYLLPRLIEKGHEVYILTRDAAKSIKFQSWALTEYWKHQESDCI
jgi:uncharacterized protein YbjT (DUF2867 family)